MWSYLGRTRNKLIMQLLDVTSQQLASGKRFVVLSQHPFQQTEVEFRGDDYDQIFWINPLADDFLIAKELVEQYQRDFQSKLGQQVLDSDHFMEYVQTRVNQFQIHSDYWRRYDNSKSSTTELKVSKDGNMRVAINSTYPGFNETNTNSCTLQGLYTKSANREYDPLIERVSETVKLARLSLQSSSQQQNTVNILTTYFLSQNIDRQSELDYSLLHNVHLDRVRLHLWTDQKPTTKDVLSKLQITQMDNLKILKSRYQQNYFDYFQYANRFLKNEVVVIQNSDIVWPQDSINALLQSLRQAPVGTMYALSRHTMDITFPLSVCKSALRGHNNNMCQQYSGSHDVIAFIPPVDPMLLRQLNFKQNTWGAENVVIELFRYYGWTVLNPCHQIKIIHIHCSNQRRATGARINPPATGLRTLRKNTVAYPTVLPIQEYQSNASL
ncbi:hypothetical protein MP228_011857 [Amoeboaphelidium protococcarum]|nr:hypothetical protein MP228_011857 [Amoeboaphelidium protococcarum]